MQTNTLVELMRLNNSNSHTPGYSLNPHKQITKRVNPITTPEWFKPGIKFTSAWIADGINTCELISFNENKNTCEVKVTTNFTNFIEDDWNLEHIIWGFKNREYTLYSSPTSI